MQILTLSLLNCDDVCLLNTKFRLLDASMLIRSLPKLVRRSERTAGSKRFLANGGGLA
ncbi:MAG: hypothetical protein LBF66_02180 [Holosporales bacterium]|nr:hypothetical protein [Holosporales bacterium]